MLLPGLDDRFDGRSSDTLYGREPESNSTVTGVLRFIRIEDDRECRVGFIDVRWGDLDAHVG